MQPKHTTLSLTSEYGTYTVSVPRTDLPADVVIEQLVVPVLLAAGYSEETLRKFLEFF